MTQWAMEYPMIELDVNGRKVSVEADQDTPLLWVIREHIGLTGTKHGCGVAQCGACTVLLDGEAARACSLPLNAIDSGQKIVTIEGLSADGSHPLSRKPGWLWTISLIFCALWPRPI
jgi:isoquinoline 1-oxidoreductase subunit alpha